MSILSEVDWVEVRRVYMDRRAVHDELLRRHEGRELKVFARLWLGLTEEAANYSAARHSLGPKILELNQDVEQRLHDLAAEFRHLKSAKTVPTLIKQAGLLCLGIGVGSEGSCMMNPRVCWVTNRRSMWTYLAIDNGIAQANEALKLFRDSDSDSEMTYSTWTGLHGEVGPRMATLAERGAQLASQQGTKPGKLRYLWADAIADHLYAQYHQ